MLLQGDICRLHQGDFRGVREWWRENTARHGWNNKLFGRKLQVLKGCLLWPKRNLLHSSTFYHKMSANRSQIEKPPRRQKVKHNFGFSEILTPTATRRTKRRVESQVYSDWKKVLKKVGWWYLQIWSLMLFQLDLALQYEHVPKRQLTH